MQKTVLTLAAVVAISCGPKQQEISKEDHAVEIDQWHAKRVENLKGPQGWLNVAGLFWLKEGMNTFGSAENNDIVFPEEKIGEYLGYFTLKNGVVTLEVGTISEIRIKDTLVNNVVVFHPDSSAANVPQMQHGSLLWFIIERDGKYGVRLRDFEADAISGFHGIERYPVDLRWRFEATLEKAEEGKTIDITNILGQTTPNRCPGTLVFKMGEDEYRLDAIDEGGPELFVIFGDLTNEEDTYPSGRYVYVAPPNAAGKTFIDFNKAYNPPCAFTQFATCPLPPRQNILHVPILAGERKYQGGDLHAQNF